MTIAAVVVLVLVAIVVLVVALRRRGRRTAWRPSDMGSALARGREKQRRRG